jgi:hypothetical protein
MKERMNGGDLVVKCATNAAHMKLVTPTMNLWAAMEMLCSLV